MCVDVCFCVADPMLFFISPYQGSTQLIMPHLSATAAATPQNALASPALGSPAPYNPYLGAAVQQQGAGGMQAFYDPGAAQTNFMATGATPQTLLPPGSMLSLPSPVRLLNLACPVQKLKPTVQYHQV